jgi:hypothetical protein
MTQLGASISKGNGNANLLAGAKPQNERSPKPQNLYNLWTENQVGLLARRKQGSLHRNLSIGLRESEAQVYCRRNVI